MFPRQARLLDSHFFSKDVYFAIGVYPPLYTYILAVLFGVYIGVGLLFGRFDSLEHVKASYFLDPFQYFLLGRIFVAILGLLSIWVLYLLVKRLYSQKIAIISIALLAVEFVHVRNSHFNTVDIPVTLFSICSIYFSSLIITKQKSLKYYIGAVFFASCAVAVKFSAFYVLLPLIYAHIYHAFKENSFKAVFSREIWISGIVGLLVFLIACPLFVLDFNQTMNGIIGTQKFEKYGKIGSGGSLLSYWTGDQSPGFGPFYPNSIPETFGYVLMFAAIVGLLIQILKHKKQDILLLTFILPTYLLFENMAYKAMRHILPILPFLMVSSAVAITWFTDRIKNKKIANFLLIAFVGFNIVFLGMKNIVYFNKLEKTDPRTAAFYWIEDNIPEHSKIVVEAFPPPLYFSETDAEQRYKVYNKEYQISQLKMTTRKPNFATSVIQMIRDEGLEYYIEDGFSHSFFDWKYTNQKYPLVVKDRERLKEWVVANSELVKSFDSENPNIQPYIKIYKMNLQK